MMIERIRSIVIQIVPPHAMRYDTVGDWYLSPDGSTLHVFVAESPVEVTNLLVGLHEAVEAVLAMGRGVTPQMVDDFDFWWRSDAYDEAGDDPAAPYHRPHVLGTVVERLMALELGLTWEAHSEAVEAAASVVSEAVAKRGT